MKDIFSLYLQSSLWGSVIIVLILLVRPLLKNASRRYLCLLWVLAAVRLLLPFPIECPLSLQPSILPQQSNSLPQSGIPYPSVDIPSATPSQPPAVSSPITLSASGVDLLTVCAGIWLGVFIVAIAYSVLSYLLLRLRLRKAVCCEPSVYECQQIPGAFLFGYFSPRIYLPVGLADWERHFILAHEKTHIARGDNWWKMLGYLCLCIHWYNPLVWVGFVFLGQDIEVACDEHVIRDMDLTDRKAYSTALLNCAKRLAGIAICPVAFGEINLKSRIQSVLSYKKPKTWSTAISLCAIVIVAFCFITTPQAANESSTPPSISKPNISVTEPTIAPNPTEPIATITEPIVSTEPISTVPEFTEPMSTKPVASEPVASEPIVTEPIATEFPVTTPPAVNNDVSSVIGYLENCVILGAHAPKADAPNHSHSYTTTTLAPLCHYAGYDSHLCSCGHVYYDNFTNASHMNASVKIGVKEPSASSSGYTIYRCSICNSEYFNDNIPPFCESYRLNTVDALATDYAASLGFQVLETHPNTSVQQFSNKCHTSSIHSSGGEKALIETAYANVDKAYSYCIDNGFSVADAVIWVEISRSTDYLIHYVTVYCSV